MPDSIAGLEATTGLPTGVCWGPAEVVEERVAAVLPPLAEDVLSLVEGGHALRAQLPGGGELAAVRAPVAVHRLARWESVVPELQQVIFRLTQRRLLLQLSARAAPSRAVSLPAAALAVDSVVVFGPSLSSLAGALCLLREGRRPLLVLDQPRQPALSSQCARALAVLQEHYPTALYLAPTLIDPQRFLEPVRNLHTLRSIALAVAVAELLRLPEVRLYDDAASALGLFDPLQAPEHHPRHPANLCALNELLSAAGGRCRLVNPYLRRTPFEVAQELLRPALSPGDVRRLPPLSDDCSGAACAACLPQQLALRALVGTQPPSAATPLSDGCEPHRTGLVDLLLCTLDLCDCSDDELLGRFPSLLQALREAGDLEIVQACRRSAVQARALLQQYWPQAARLF